jgi:hypothetical protein
MRIDISPSTGDEAAKIVASVLRTPPDVLKRAKTIFESVTKK